MFTSVSIETYSACNRKCVDCFRSEKFPKRSDGIMEDWLWKKTLSELGEIEYKGKVNLYFYCEPLLDKRIFEIIRYANDKCPGSVTKIATNGDFLTEENLKKLAGAGLKRLIVSNYDDNEKPELYKRLSRYSSQIIILARHHRKIKKIDRFGQVFKQREPNTTGLPCNRPATQFVITWNGNVVLCCNDFYSKHIFGNVKQSSIIDIWNSNKLNSVKKLLLNGQRNKVDICEYCNA